jgi:hypothetical protein
VSVDAATLKMAFSPLQGRHMAGSGVSQNSINPLMPELNPFTQHCLTRFFLLGILLLEPCI